MHWDHFFPPTHLHELDFEISDDMIYILTHDIFVLDLSLFWFMMKHKGRYRGMLLDWLHWLFDYTQHSSQQVSTGKKFYFIFLLIDCFILVYISMYVGVALPPRFYWCFYLRSSRSTGYARDTEVLMRSMVSTCPRVGARCYPPLSVITRRSYLEAHRS